MVWWGQSESLCYKCLFWRDQGQQIAFAILRGHFHLMDCLGASSTCPAVPYHQAFPYWYVWSLKSQDFNLCPKWLAVHLKWYTYNNFTAWCVRSGGRKMQEECEVSFLCMWDWDTVSGGPFFDGGGGVGGEMIDLIQGIPRQTDKRGGRGGSNGSLASTSLTFLLYSAQNLSSSVHLIFSAFHSHIIMASGPHSHIFSLFKVFCFL